MSIIYVKSDTGKKEIAFTPPMSLSSLLHEFNVSAPCGGNHTCGKCKVRASGNLSPVSQDEKKLLTASELKNDIRLSCAVTAFGDCEVELSGIASDNSAVMLENANARISADGYIIAADIGTTTVAAYLYKDGRLLNSLGEQNEQGKYGADVITRIGAGTPDLLYKTIVSQLTKLFANIIENITSYDEIELIVITGNTTMLHFLCNLDPAGIAVYPFTPKSLFGTTAELFGEFRNAEVYLPPCVSSYVGADVLCSVIASDMCENSGISVLADIGTNGEMAIFKDGKLFTCSTAAGPALEGATVKMGTVAKKGAISRVYLDGNVIKYETIGDEKPVGICGSGLISAMALFVKAGIIDETGMIDTECSDFKHLYSDCDGELCVNIGDSGVIITQKDIRQFQLAKSAICAGLLTLLNECEVTAENVERFYICGGFGSCLDIKSAVATGLIPSGFKDRAAVLGNAAGMGAALLASPERRREAESIAENAVDLELSTNEYFMEQYIERMYFSEI